MRFTTVHVNLDRVLTVCLIVCALLVSVTLVRQNLGATTSAGRTRTSEVAPTRSEVAPTRVDNWNEVRQWGTRVGSATAPVQIVEFADFECPACRRFHETYAGLAARMPDSVALSYVHFPLSYHRHARAAAHAAECAGAQGRFGAMADELYRGQAQFAQEPWSRFAQAAGVRDTAQFVRCLGSTDPLAVIEAGMAHGRRMRVDGTPTILINGWQIDGVPDAPALDSLVRSLLRSR